MKATLDHLVLGAETLEQGVDYIESKLGVTVPRGGEHPKFGTHNCVMRLGDNCYFEIIAVNPEAQSAATPRWYGLDDARVKKQLAKCPSIIAWVASVNDLSVAEAAADWINGEILDLVRGSMHWQMLVPAAGLADDPLLPWLIHWPPGQHPLPRLSSLDCSLVKLGVSVREPDLFTARLNAIGAQSLIEVEANGVDKSSGSAPEIASEIASENFRRNGYLRVTIRSPKGLVDLPWVFDATAV